MKKQRHIKREKKREKERVRKIEKVRNWKFVTLVFTLNETGHRGKTMNLVSDGRRDTMKGLITRELFEQSKRTYWLIRRSENQT